MGSSMSDEMFPTATGWMRPHSETNKAALPATSEDEALMLKVQAGDHNALAQLLERHARLVLGIGRRILRDDGEAQELVQDVGDVSRNSNRYRSLSSEIEIAVARVPSVR